MSGHWRVQYDSIQVRNTVQAILADPSFMRCLESILLTLEAGLTRLRSWQAEVEPVFRDVSTELDHVSRGYVPFFVQDGMSEIEARRYAGHLRVLAVQFETEQKEQRESFLHFVRQVAGAKPNEVCALCAGTSLQPEYARLIQNAFRRAGSEGREIDFIRLSEQARRGHVGPAREMIQLATAVREYLPRASGRALSPSSAAHELLLHLQHERGHPSRYSWKDEEGRATDPLTIATAKEFGLDYFDPRPAARRASARLGKRGRLGRGETAFD